MMASSFSLFFIAERYIFIFCLRYFLSILIFFSSYPNILTVMTDEPSMRSTGRVMLKFPFASLVFMPLPFISNPTPEILLFDRASLTVPRIVMLSLRIVLAAALSGIKYKPVNKTRRTTCR